MNKLDQAKLNSKVPRKDTELFKYVGEKKKLTKVNILDEVYEGKIIGDYVEEWKSLKSALEHLLISHGYELLDNKTKSILDTLKEVLVIDPTREYASVELVEGFISKYVPITEKIIKHDKLLLNVSNGCHEVINHKAVLNKEQQKKKILGGT